MPDAVTYFRAVDSTDRGARQRVLEAAIAILGDRGLITNLLTEAASDADCSVDRAQLWFNRDEDLILALYCRLATDLEARVPELAPGTIADRFQAVMQAKLALVATYKDAFAALLATLLDPRSPLGVLSDSTEIVRSRVLGAFAAVVYGAEDRPGDDNAPGLIRTLYGIHLALLLLWTQDRTEDSASARNGLDLAHGLLALAGPFLAMPDAAMAFGRVDSVLAPLIEPAPDADATATAGHILRTLFRHRRLQPGAGECAVDPCPQCLALHLPRVRRFVLAGEPIHLLLPAFPAKSPSLQKVLGALPDRAEELALEYLAGVCAEIEAVYAPGARITICSDGRVFSDLVGVSDEDVSGYGAGIEALIRDMGLTMLDTFSMDDLYPDASFYDMRVHLDALYSEPVETIQERVRAFEHHRSLFNGIERFMWEERPQAASGTSKTQERKLNKERAYRVVQRSEAWGRVVSECFPAALRLSIHPQAPHAEKIGILLGDAADTWITPWHGVAVHQGERWTLMKRFDAEALGGEIFYRGDAPSYIEVPQ